MTFVAFVPAAFLMLKLASRRWPLTHSDVTESKSYDVIDLQIEMVGGSLHSLARIADSREADRLENYVAEAISELRRPERPNKIEIHQLVVGDQINQVGDHNTGRLGKLDP